MSIKFETVDGRGTEMEQWNELLDNAALDNKCVVADFTATWCGPCKRISPQFDRMASGNPECVFVKVDVDAYGAVASSCNVQAMPSFHVYSGSGTPPILSLVGSDLSKLEDLVKKAAGQRSSSSKTPTEAAREKEERDVKEKAIKKRKGKEREDREEKDRDLKEQKDREQKEQRRQLRKEAEERAEEILSRKKTSAFDQILAEQHSRQAQIEDDGEDVPF